MPKYRSMENKIRDMYVKGRKISDNNEEDSPITARGNMVTDKEPTMCGPNPATITVTKGNEKIHPRISESNTIRAILNKINNR